jgi:hypothetical protein
MSEIVATAYQSELNFIANCVLDYPDLETGGDYFGFWNKYNMPVVVFVTGPGPKTSRSPTSFYQDIDYLHKTGNYINENHALEHIGSWHSHHKLGLEHPSGGDVNTMRNALSNQNLNRFFITICNIKESSKIKINGFLFSNDYSSFYKEVEWNVIAQVSPIRKQEKDNPLFTKPNTQKSTFLVTTTKKRITNATEPEKVQLTENSYFDTTEGKEFLKKEFFKIKNNSDCSNVEIIQNDDKTIGITFTYFDKEIEIRYPNDFSKDNPNPIINEKDKDQIINTHTIQAEPSKTYFFKPFDLFKEFRKTFFGFIIDDK